MIIPGNAKDTGVPHTFYTGDTNKFFPDVLHIPIAELEQKIVNWSINLNAGGIETLASLRSTIAAHLLEGLRTSPPLYIYERKLKLTNTKLGKVTHQEVNRVQYTNYASSTVLARNFVLVNLIDDRCEVILGTNPDDAATFNIVTTVTAMKSPHDLTSKTVARALKRRLQSGETYWTRLTPLNRVCIEKHLEDVAGANPLKTNKRSDSGGTHKRPAKRARTSTGETLAAASTSNT